VSERPKTVRFRGIFPSERKLDPDIQQMMEEDLQKHPEFSDIQKRFTKLHDEAEQTRREKAKEYPHSFQLLDAHVKKLRIASIPFHIHSKEYVDQARGKPIETYIVGFKTEQDFHKAMKYLKIEK